MSCGRAVCPPGPVQRDVDPVAGGGDRAGAQADLPDRHRRVAVQRERPGGAVEDAGGDHLGGAAGHGLLGRLEDAAHRAGQPVERGQRQRDAQDDGGVHVVPAGVAEALAGGGVRHVLEVGQRQRVDVGAQHDDRVARRRRRRPARCPVGSRRGVSPALAQPLLEEGRRLELGEGQLGVGVQVPAGGDQLRAGASATQSSTAAPELLDDGGHAACPARRRPARPRAGRPVGQAVAHLGEQAVDDRPQVAAVRGGHRPLPLVGGADGEHPLDVGQLGLAAQPLAPSARSSSTRSTIACRTGRTVPFSSTTMSASRP